MKKVRLGKTGLMVSRVGMGGIPIQRSPFNEAVRIVQKASDLGSIQRDQTLSHANSNGVKALNKMRGM